VNLLTCNEPGYTVRDIEVRSYTKEGLDNPGPGRGKKASSANDTFSPTPKALDDQPSTWQRLAAMRERLG
jgi:hypothetical protein